MDGGAARTSWTKDGGAARKQWTDACVLPNVSIEAVSNVHERLHDGHKNDGVYVQICIYMVVISEHSTHNPIGEIFQLQKAKFQ